MYTDICNFPTCSELPTLSSHYATLLFRHDKTFNSGSDVQSREGRDRQHQWDSDHWHWGEESILVIVTTRGGSGHYKWSVRGTDGERAGETSKSGSLCCVMASAYL